MKMGKTGLSSVGVMCLALGFTACGSDEDASKDGNNPGGPEQRQVRGEGDQEGRLGESLEGYRSDTGLARRVTTFLSGKQLSSIRLASGATAGARSPVGVALCSDGHFYLEGNLVVTSGERIRFVAGSEQSGTWVVVTKGQLIRLVLSSTLGDAMSFEITQNKDQVFVDQEPAGLAEASRCP